MQFIFDKHSTCQERVARLLDLSACNAPAYIPPCLSVSCVVRRTVVLVAVRKCSNGTVMPRKPIP